MKMEFEYDKAKSISNKKKHGVNFEEAQTLWMGDYLIFPAITKGEPRKMLVGKIGSKFYSCVFAEKGKRIRIITCRRSRDKEERDYYEKE